MCLPVLSQGPGYTSHMRFSPPVMYRILHELEGMNPMLNFHQLEQGIEARMHKSHIPGLALAIVQDHKLIYARGFGVTSVEDGCVPVTPETLFRIGSITKPLTGTAIMRLVEVGKLDLDTPVKAYIEWFRLSDPEATKHVTLRMQLGHLRVPYY